MPNAKDFQGGTEKFLVIGQTGSGKTTLFTTLPGKKFMYIFDPNALNSIQGQDIDYELFTPDVLDLKAKSLKKNVEDRATERLEPTTYVSWEQDFEWRIKSGFFNDYDALGFDSLTTFSDIVMDRIQFLNGRFGRQPEQDDWAAQINTIKKVIRAATSLPLNFFATAHKDLKQDQLTKKVEYQIVLPGQLRVKLPLLFSEIYNCDVVMNDKGKSEYRIQTKPDRYHPVARCTLGLDQFADVTVPRGSKDNSQYGIGKILREHPRNK